MRVLEPSGDSGFDRESLSDDVKIKTEFGMEASKAKELPLTRESEIFPVYHSYGGALMTRK